MTMPARGGPYVKGAFLCGDVIEGRDGTNSYIRVADRITVEAGVIRVGTPPAETAPLALPEAIPQGTVLQTWAVIMLVAGGAKGRHVITLKIRRPDGQVADYGAPVDVQFDERRSSGVNLHVNMTILNPQEGGYEVIVEVDGQEKTRIFFDVIFQRRGYGGA